MPWSPQRRTENGKAKYSGLHSAELAAAEKSGAKADIAGGPRRATCGHFESSRQQYETCIKGLLQISYCFKSEEASGMTCSKGSGRIEICPVKGRS